VGLVIIDGLMNDANFMVSVETFLLDGTNAADGEGALTTWFELTGTDCVDGTLDFLWAIAGKILKPRDG
jgi:hypothetical protein